MMIDISMPRDLIRRRRNAGYAAICAIGVSSDPKVFRLCTAENVEGVLAQLQPGTWEKLHFGRLVWTQGLAVARTIVTGAERALEASARPLGAHWYRGEFEALDALLEQERAKLRGTFWSHADLIARLRRQADREADRFAEGIF